MARGWGGDPPRDDAEARERIIDAAMRCIDRYGPHKTGLSDVATELGITRQTVYRLYPSTEALLIAVAAAAADGFLDRLAAHVRGVDDPADAVVECMAFTFDRLPHERFLGILLTTGRSEAFLRGVTSPSAIAFGRQMLDRMAVDWQAEGYGDAELDELAEFGLRMIQSLVLDPPREDLDVRSFLRRWVAPSVGASTTVSGPAKEDR